MPKVKFTGHILPAVIKISTQGHPTVNWKASDYGIEATLNIVIQDSLVTVDCEVNKSDQRSLGLLYSRAHDCVETTTNMLCISRGEGLSVVLDKCVMPDGKIEDTLIYEGEIPKFMTAISLPADFAKILQLALNEPLLFYAIRDMAESVKISRAAPTNCARAVESIRNYFIPEGGTREQGWPPMRANLNLSESYLRSITELSRGPRHGHNYEGITDTSLREAARRTWTVMNRFLEFRKQDNQPLSPSDFPPLD